MQKNVQKSANEYTLISNDKETKVEIFHAEKTPTREHRYLVVTES